MSLPFIVPEAARIAIFRNSISSSTFQNIGSSALFCAIMLSANALAADGPLTLARAQRLAVARSHQISAQDDAVTASQEIAVAAGQLPDPVLKTAIENVPVNGAHAYSLTSEPMTMRRIGLSQDITSSDKRRLRAERYVREADKSLAEKNRMIAEIERNTALAWLDRYYAEAMAAVIAELGLQSRNEMQAADGAYRAGRGNQADVFAARSAIALFDDRASEIDLRVRNTKIMLARWIGETAQQPLADGPAIDVIPLDPLKLETQLAQHPQILVLSRLEDLASTEAQLADADRSADWSVEVAYQQRGPAYANMFSVGVSIALQWDQKNRQDRQLRSKLALVAQVMDEREEALRAIVAETRGMIDEWQNKRERVARYRTELVPYAGERTGAVLAAYRGGKSSLADVLAARRNEIDVRLQALQLEADTARLWAQLKFLFPTEQSARHIPSQGPAMLTKDAK
ncbi:MAG: TolC family protein [Burkholderiales bacterium]|nr:TolC family protein [Burkholderiales bacterium]